jgi:hypothetical protein
VTVRENERNEANKAHSRLVLIGRPTVTQEYLLKACPPKEGAERLLFLFFNSSNPLLPLVHRPTFLAEVCLNIMELKVTTQLTFNSTISSFWIQSILPLLGLPCISACYH